MSTIGRHVPYKIPREFLSKTQQQQAAGRRLDLRLNLHSSVKELTLRCSSTSRLSSACKILHKPHALKNSSQSLAQEERIYLKKLIQKRKEKRISCIIECWRRILPYNYQNSPDRSKQPRMKKKIQPLLQIPLLQLSRSDHRQKIKQERNTTPQHFELQKLCISTTRHHQQVRPPRSNQNSNTKTIDYPTYYNSRSPVL